MSTLQFDRSERRLPNDVAKPPCKEEMEKAAQRRSSLRDDVLYIAGAVLVTMGLGELRIYLAFISLGAFCLLTPLLGLAQSFLRGIRPQPRR